MAWTIRGPRPDLRPSRGHSLAAWVAVAALITAGLLTAPAGSASQPPVRKSNREYRIAELKRQFGNRFLDLRPLNREEFNSKGLPETFLRRLPLDRESLDVAGRKLEINVLREMESKRIPIFPEDVIIGGIQVIENWDENPVTGERRLHPNTFMPFFAVTRRPPGE
jgi:hypothetical protein